MKILMYHYVKKKSPKYFRNLKFLNEAKFIFQLRKIISSKERVYSWEDIVNGEDEKQKHPNSGWLLTFDDGLLDHYTSVADILDHYKLPAIFFISTGNLSGKFLRVHLLQYLIASFDNDNAFVNFMKRYMEEYGLNHSELPRSYTPNRWDTNSLSAIKFIIQSVLSEEEALSLLNDIYRLRKIKIDKEFHEEIYLNKDHIRQIAARFNLGLHSHQHNRFSTLREAQIKEDLVLNINNLSSLGLGHSVNLPLALPYGVQAKKNITGLYSSLNISHVFNTVPDVYSGRNIKRIPRFDCNDFDNLIKN
jgi:peptidoglycan/xylan/chitin deacetylase (PgdA/CDA1 family)